MRRCVWSRNIKNWCSIYICIYIYIYDISSLRVNIHGSVYRNMKSVEITNKMQPCNRIYYSKIYWRHNMPRTAHRPSSGAPNCICSLWFIYPCGDRPLSRLGENRHNWPVPTRPGQRWTSLVCRSKHVEPSINFGIINSITRLNFVGYFYWFILQIHYMKI